MGHFSRGLSALEKLERNHPGKIKSLVLANAVKADNGRTRYTAETDRKVAKAASALTKVKISQEEVKRFRSRHDIKCYHKVPKDKVKGILRSGEKVNIFSIDGVMPRLTKQLKELDEGDVKLVRDTAGPYLLVNLGRRCSYIAKVLKTV